MLWFLEVNYIIEMNIYLCYIYLVVVVDCSATLIEYGSYFLKDVYTSKSKKNVSINSVYCMVGYSVLTVTMFSVFNA